MSATVAEQIRGDIDTPRPLLARAGHVELVGWCLDSLDRAPAVRLVTEAGILLAKVRHLRPDLDNIACGFTIEGELPSGIYVARLEAERAENDWIEFRRYSLRVDPVPLIAVLESPLESGVITSRTRPAGWTVHPEQEIKTVQLRFGHQQTACDFPLVRDDVANLLPHLPRARQSGFIAAGNIPAGFGPLRIRAELADGSIAIAPTRLRVAIAEDENIDGSLRLDSPRIPLPGYTPARGIEPAPPSRSPRNILFVLPGTFASNNALHAAGLANELAATGHVCAVAVRGDLNTLAHHAAPRFAALTHSDAPEFLFPNGRGPDLIHAWTTRESVRKVVERIHAAVTCALVVHLEDNEEQLLALSLDKEPGAIAHLSETELDRLVTADLSHPRRAREFLARADGITVINERLREFVPPAARCLTLWPAADARYFHPREKPADFRRLLDLHPDTTVLFYPGNAHAANAAEMRELYRAVSRMNASGIPVTLIRTGLDSVEFQDHEASQARKQVIELGQILHHRHLPPLMSLADVFVQPGGPDAFNDYRFPSKLPEFFAIGRPVVLPRTNLGEKVRHGVDAYVLDRADADGICGAITHLRREPDLAARLARGAVAFAAQHFSWRRSAEALAKFYDSLATS